MAKEQKTYTKEFKEEAVRLVQSSQKSQAQIARDLGVADSTLSRLPQGTGGTRQRRISWQWTPGSPRRREPPFEA